MTADQLSLAALNRATLDRQLLLHRHALPARHAIEHLTGMQAQAPLAPYVGLWTRLAGFVHQDLEDLLSERSVVRAHAHRSTIHLLTAEDYLSFRPLFQPLADRGLAANFGRNLRGVDLDELREFAKVLLSQAPLTRAQLATRLAERWPGHEPSSLAYAATHLLPLVQVPPRGLWGHTGQATYFLAAAWLDGRPRRTPPDPAAWLDGRASHTPPDRATALERLVLRYLAAYGPATVNDIQTWSGLSRLREVTDRLGARLRPFTGPDGARLLDLADATRPDPDVPAPPRFLPGYDNLLLSFAERRRVIPHDRPVPLPPGNGATTGTLLVDGLWRADWTITRGRDRAVLHVAPFGPLGHVQADTVVAEGRRLLEFAAPAAAHDVRFGGS
ncbi:MAG TPA: winged helix DNA-binding domain-containing protein [Streptosporangiaceae bacterium]|nr:winged helix DNA-binding domain-containing protein [Streptosporangiaceae bacterium]